MVQLGELMMILDLHRQGLSVTAIARRTGRDPKTIRGVEDAANVRREGIERHDLGLGAPALGDGGLLRTQTPSSAPSATSPARRRLHDRLPPFSAAATGLRFCKRRRRGCTSADGRYGLDNSHREDDPERVGKPFRPPTMASRMFSTPRSRNSFMTRSQSLAPSFCSSQSPSISLAPSARTPR